MYTPTQKYTMVALAMAIAILVWGEQFGGFENFENPNVSSGEDVSGGASEYYNWGYKEIPDEMEDKIPHTRHRCNRCRRHCYIPVPYRRKRYPCPHCKTKIHIRNDIYLMKGQGECASSDITKNRDIDKYVLKSSVPSCPDMSQFVRKSQLRPEDNNRGGHQPRRPDCPKCPICPICPKCPDPEKISEHPEFNKYTLKDDYRISSESRRTQTDFGIGGDEEPGPGNRTGGIPRVPGLDLGMRDHDVAKRGTTPKAGDTPDPYFKDFAYNNRGSGRVRAYNSVWSVFG